MSQPRASFTTGPDDATILVPAGNNHYFIPQGGILVAGDVGSNVQEVWVKILRLSAAVPADPSIDPAGGWVVAQVDAASATFSHPNVRRAVTEALVGSADNKVVAIPRLADGTFGNANEAFFRARPAREEVAVSARHCLWFAFADPGLPGPGPAGDREGDTANHKPPLLSVPENAGSLDVEAQGRWRHFHPVDGVEHEESDADGMAPNVGLQLGGYQSAVYSSQGISVPNNFPVNSLIGLWVDAAGSPVGNPFVIGKLSAGIIIPPDAGIKKLCLAFHDGQRWHNNSGFMTVMIDWGEAQNRLRLRERVRRPVT